MKTAEQIYHAVMEGNMKRAFSLLEEAERTTTFQAMIDTVMTPLFDRVGNIEQTEALNLAQGYIISRLVKRLLKDFREMGVSPPENVGIAVMCNAEDDCHPLGREITSSILAARGWKVRDLGIDTTAEELVDTAQEEGAHVVGVSAMTHSTAMNAARVRELLDSRGLSGRIGFAVGGVAFRVNPGLVEEVGADGTAGTAFEAHDLFLKLKATLS